MSERRKEYAWTIVLFTAAILLGSYTVFSKKPLGAMSLLDAKLFCGAWSLACTLGGALALIGDKRLNDWINPRLAAYSKRRKDAKKQREIMRVLSDLENPSRVARREARKKRLLCVAGWALLLSPLVAIVASVISIFYFKTEIYYMVLAISVFYAVQLWGFLFKAFMQMKNEDK